MCRAWSLIMVFTPSIISASAIVYFSLAWISWIKSVLCWVLSSAWPRAIIRSFADLSAFYFTLFFMLLALLPNRIVESVSRSLYLLYEQVITRQVYEFPPSDSCKMRVSFESLYGMKEPFLLSVSALITFPSAERDLFIILASSRVGFIK